MPVVQVETIDEKKEIEKEVERQVKFSEPKVRLEEKEEKLDEKAADKKKKEAIAGVEGKLKPEAAPVSPEDGSDSGEKDPKTIPPDGDSS